MLIVFWTDGLIFLLLLGVILFAFYVRGKEHLRRPWRKIVGHKIGMVSLVVLAGFLLIGFLDSVHFKPQIEPSGGDFGGEPISLFDWWATPLREQNEKTYSAPFAWHLYGRENIIGADSTKVWGYRRLKYGGAHLTNPAEERILDIIDIGATGASKGLTVSLLIGFFGIFARARWLKIKFWSSAREIMLAQTQVPWRLVFITLLIIITGGYTVVELSAKYHVFGTDKVGQDVLYQSLKSIRTGLIIGTLTTLIMLPFALILGILAGYYRGWTDDVIQYLYTTLNSIPGVLLIAASILVVQVYMANHEEDFASIAIRADTRLLFLCLILGITSWTGLCRLLRAETLKLREMEYVQAARAMGVNSPTILVRHILPNVFHIVLISVVLDFSGLVLAEAVLSYVNIGVDHTTDSWCNMINSARLEMAREPIVWWSLVAAFIFMFSLVLAANLFADAVRDAFDPRRSD